MLTLISRSLSRMALGAGVFVLVAACGDIPSSPTRTVLAPPILPAVPVPRAADFPVLDAALPALAPGERIRRAVLPAPDGGTLHVESVLGRDGRPRVTLMRRAGAVVLRVDNEWTPTADWNSVAQRVTFRGGDGLVHTFDSRSLSPNERAQARAVLQQQAERLRTSAAGPRIRSLEEDGGACDAEIKAANIATWQYTAAGSTVLLASLTGNVMLTTTLYSAYLSAYANYESKQAELDKCIANIGKKPEVDEH
ncbi:MAG: hypothetical protein FJ363_00425 [Gemmatimonadetes bacterium]|nr:hypothetical protein [Gemmatimonadota bacterium]